MPRCFVCHRPATHIEASCAMRVTITARHRFEQVEERKRYYCTDHHSTDAIELQETP